MGRMDAPPFARGETYANGDQSILTGTYGNGLGFGGINLQGKEFIFEPNSQDDEAGVYANLGPDPCGRPIKVKVVRNVSGQSLLPGRVVKFCTVTNPAGLTTLQTGLPYESQVDGYCTQVTDVPAGVVDEFLPAAGVPNGDLFYIVRDGPTLIATGQTTGASLVPGERIVVAPYGASAGDSLGGRVGAQDLTGTTGSTALNILNQLGFAASIVTTTQTNVNVPVIVDLDD